MKITTIKSPIAACLLTAIFACCSTARASTPATPAIEARLQLTGTSRELAAPFHGHNAVAGDYWNTPLFRRNLSTLHNQFLRIPGGEMANYWDWNRGSVVDQPIPLQRLNSKRDIRVSVHTYAGLLKSSSLTPIFVLNLMTSTLEEQLSALQTFADLGVEVAYVELGNELYKDDSAYSTRFPTADDYISEVKIYSSALRLLFMGWGI